MRIAAFADVHGNVWALERVLAAIGRARPDAIVFLGDALLRVPEPKETMALLRSVEHRAVRGNYDWYVLGDYPNQAQRLEREPYQTAEVAWTRAQLTRDDIAYVEAMPVTFRLFEGAQQLVVCHASPGKAFGGLFPTKDSHHWGMSDEQCLELLVDEPAPTILCAHTHAVMERVVDRYRVINPGSVSLGWNQHDEMDGWARWALLEWDGQSWQVDFRREAYDPAPVWEAYERWELWPMMREYPKPEWWGQKARALALESGANL